MRRLRPPAVKRTWRQVAQLEFRLRVEAVLTGARRLSGWIEPAVGKVSVEDAVTAWRDEVRAFLAAIDRPPND